MRVLFDHQALCLERFGGITRYHVELARQFAAMDEVHARWFGGIHRSGLTACPCPLSGIRLPWIPRLGYPLQVLSGQILPWLPGPVDVLHQTYVHPFRAPRGAARVVTVYDCIYERFPELFGDARRTIAGRRRSLELASAVICISHHAKAELLRYHPVDPARIHVTHLGCTALPAPLPARPHPRPYLLFVGKRAGYKDFAVVAAAWAADPAIHGAVDLVAFGGGPFAPHELELVAGHPAAGRMLQWGGDDQRLATAYGHAEAVLVPSRAEGFGLPVLEAMSLGAPVLAADATSLPEVAGGAGLLVPAGDQQAWSAAMRRLLADADLRAGMVRRGRAQAAAFTWRRCAEQTRAAYADAMEWARRDGSRLASGGG